MKTTIIFSIIVLFLTACLPVKNQENSTNISDIITVASQKMDNSILHYRNSNLNPRSIDSMGHTLLVPAKDWTSGFYPGCLWYMYELSKDTLFENTADLFTRNIENEKRNGKTHDMGFKMYCSYGNAYRITGKEYYREVLIESAQTLISRFDSTVGCIRSWDHHKEVWEFPVIIDNMMNLELLMWAFHETKDSVYYNIAVSHADKTLKNHFRKDFSTYHVVDYDTLTGKVIKKNTHQGLAHESAWARGQAWGLYGYTMMYRETKKDRYLNQAEKIANFILSHKNLPKDMIPYWDFDAPNIPNEPRDASAAAVISSALFELSKYSDEKKTNYMQAAESILNTLCSESYFAKPDASHYFLLEHSTGNMPDNSEIDAPIIYADYYFLEALKRKISLNNED